MGQERVLRFLFGKCTVIVHQRLANSRHFFFRHDFTVFLLVLGGGSHQNAKTFVSCSDAIFSVRFLLIAHAVVG